MVGAIVLGYVLSIVFINGQGRTTLRLLTEMALAQRIHASLVPALLRSDERLEVDGASFASTEMGGDLVDMVDHGTTTDLVLADVSGHGVKAGVVMGMVKSAIRMGLREDRGLERLAGDLRLPGARSTLRAAPRQRRAGGGTLRRSGALRARRDRSPLRLGIRRSRRHVLRTATRS